MSYAQKPIMDDAQAAILNVSCFHWQRRCSVRLLPFLIVLLSLAIGHTGTRLQLTSAFSVGISCKLRLRGRHTDVYHHHGASTAHENGETMEDRGRAPAEMNLTKDKAPVVLPEYPGTRVGTYPGIALEDPGAPC
eukprot:2811672-Rhodomonas_salina.2